MFYRLIEQKRNEWLASADCTITSLLMYIEQRGMMRDAQLEAIKTYLFLKIACQNRPLWQLFCEGRFNITDLAPEELTVETREVLTSNPAALALFQYSRLKDKNGKQLAKQLEDFIRHHAKEIDYEQAYRDIFYQIDYPDYLYSLPMGAGKTYLMAAFIYIDLYFAQNEPNNPIWAHNFLVLAPSGLKSSIVPSLRSIRGFDPSWIFPEETAKRLKRLIHFEILDEQKSANKSNIVKNPNAHKVNMHIGDGESMGLIAVTNAEKVILDRIEDQDKDPSLFTNDEEYKKAVIANELRNVIGQIPHLAVLIDEVHHATDGEIKLRQVVSNWARTSQTFTNVLGFSGTPYLEKTENITLGEGFSIRNTDISNVVYFYPLIDGIDNFLKRPVVKHTDSDWDTIVDKGVREFMDLYKDTVYSDGCCAKLAIYCGLIATLEEDIYPKVAEIITEYGFNPADVILKRHKGNTPKNGETKYPEPEGSEAAFTALDTPFSKTRIVLLAQIGKEGWDCRSLTGIILPHENACPTNMVLQTSCRCLRQTQRGARESALIWMNRWNADKLNKELKQQQNITLQEFANKPHKQDTLIHRYSRKDQQAVPPIDFYQLKVEYQTILVENQPDVKERLSSPALLVKSTNQFITTQDLSGKTIALNELQKEEGEAISYAHWLDQIARESFSTLSLSALQAYDAELHAIYAAIMSEGVENPAYDHQRIRSLIRQAFVPKRTFQIVEDIVPDEASLLVGNIASTFSVADTSRVYPTDKEVNEILDWDAHPDKGEVPEKVQAAIQQLRDMGLNEQADILEANAKQGTQTDPHPERHQTYHYLPYHFDSKLEVEYFAEALRLALKDTHLEYYFNGDDTLTEFKIRCFKRVGKNWQYDGWYVPDFLVISRDSEGKIDRICIIETKGEIYASKFADRLQFMRDTFVPKNNERFGRERFQYLYIKDSLSLEQQVAETKQMIKDFFNA